MNTRHLRSIFRDVISQELIGAAAARHGLQLRLRKKDVIKLITALILASANGDGGRQAAVLKRYFEDGGLQVSRSAAYEWFDEKLSKVLADIALNCLSIVKAQSVDLPGWLGEHVDDWWIVDSTTCKLDDRLTNVYPGTGDYAAIKVHKTMSMGVGTVVDYSFSPAREHDSKHLKIDERWGGKGLVADLAYASFATFQDCQKYDVRFVLRLKDGWRPKVTEIHRGTVKKQLVKDKEFDLVISKNILLDGKAIDLSAKLEKNCEELPVRIVGICDEKNKYQFFLTNLPRRVGPDQVSDLYRCRWEIEMDNKTNKSCFSLDDIQSYTPAALHVMLHAAMIGSMIACLLAHAENMKNRPEPTAKELPVRDYAPLHPKLIAGYMSTATEAISNALSMQEGEADDEWSRIGSLILRFGKDINWRSRPSILDQLRGWPMSTSSSKYPRKRS